MDKKIIILIIALFICIAAGGYYLVTSGTSDNYVTVNNGEFKIPDGYKAVDQKYSVNLTNGDNYICIKKNVSNDIKKEIKDYKKDKQKSNHTVKISNFTLNDTFVYKSTIKGSHIVHYWFEKNGNVYELYTRSDDSDTDKIIEELITTMK